MPLDHTPFPPGGHRSVPFICVADFDATCAFYALLGSETLEVLSDADGRPSWAWAQTKSGGSCSVVAQLMFSRTWRPILPGNQDISSYMCSLDASVLRLHRLDAGVRDGGDASAWNLPAGSRRASRTLFAIHHPSHMPPASSASTIPTAIASSSENSTSPCITSANAVPTGGFSSPFPMSSFSAYL